MIDPAPARNCAVAVYDIAQSESERAGKLQISDAASYEEAERQVATFEARPIGPVSSRLRGRLGDKSSPLANF
jgi:hypothetical protein